MTSKKNNILLTAFMLLSLYGAGQHRYSASLDPVKETGFYSIAITPELSSYLKSDLSDLRIVDKKKQAVPFFIDIPPQRLIEHVLFKHDIVLKQNRDSKTTLIIGNENKTEVSSFILELKNAAAKRTASLSGSDDNVHWYVILDSLKVQSLDENDRTLYSQRINIPPSEYRFFRLIINNEGKDPLNILHIRSAMSVQPENNPAAIFFNPPPAVSQKDSGAYSLIKIMYARPHQFNFLQLRISRPFFYNRPARLFTGLKGTFPSIWNSSGHHSITISSDDFSIHPFPLLKTDTLCLLIENGDNLPLHISSITTGLFKRNIITHLEKDKQYTLLLDNPLATAPAYDLEHFKDRISSIKELPYKKVTALPQPQNVTLDKRQISRWWIWPVVTFIILLLSLLTWKLTTDMRKDPGI